MSEPKTIVEYGKRCLLCRTDAAASRMLCWKHVDELADMLDELNEGLPFDDIPPSIPAMVAALDPSPGGSGLDDRHAPGFASTPPGSLHIMAMRDARSCAHPVVDEWYSCAPGGYPDVAHPHFEDDHAVRAIDKSLHGLAEALVDELVVDDGAARVVKREIDPDPRAVCVWLFAHVTELSRLGWADEAFRDLRDLREQLRRVIDPPPKPLGHCVNDIVLDRATGETGECGHALYPPAGRPMARDEPVRDVPVVECSRCRATYDGLAQLRLSIAELKAEAS